MALYGLNLYPLSKMFCPEKAVCLMGVVGLSGILQKMEYKIYFQYLFNHDFLPINKVFRQ